MSKNQKEPNHKAMWDNLKFELSYQPIKTPKYRLVDINELERKIHIDILNKMNEIENKEEDKHE